MTDTTDRPEVDDPRVLALARARQQMAYENPFNAVCPPWDGLTEQEQHLSLLDARNYLRAALKAGLVPAASAAAPAADRVKAIADAIGPNMLFGLQDAELFGEPGQERIRDWIKWISETVAALPATVLPAPADRAASTAPLAAGLPLVKGNCPSCGGASLFLGDGGYVTCSRIDCREPDAASTALERRTAAGSVAVVQARPAPTIRLRSVSGPEWQSACSGPEIGP